MANLGNGRSIKYDNCVLMNYYSNSDLQQFLRKNRQTISFTTILGMLVQTARAIRFMKNVHMTHFDIKSNNILVSRSNTIKVGDFGEAYIPIPIDYQKNRQFTRADLEDRRPGYTLPYSPPEVFNDTIDYDKYGHKIDVFSFGVLMMEVLFDAFPITMRPGDNNNDKLVQALKDGTYQQYILASVERLSYYFNRTVAHTLCYVGLRCLEPDPIKRPCIDWIVIILKDIYNHIN